MCMLNFLVWKRCSQADLPTLGTKGCEPLFFDSSTSSSEIYRFTVESHRGASYYRAEHNTGRSSVSSKRLDGCEVERMSGFAKWISVAEKFAIRCQICPGTDVFLVTDAARPSRRRVAGRQGNGLTRSGRSASRSGMFAEGTTVVRFMESLTNCRGLRDNDGPRGKP
jgi:hypothetical protein